jgi:small subunit ribosomal protein S8
MSKTFILFVNHINQNLRRKKFELFLPKSNTTLRLVSFFYQEGYFDFFYCKNNKIFFKIRQFSQYAAINKLVFSAKSGHKKQQKIAIVRTYSSKNFGSLVYSTSKGFLSEKQASKAGFGGLLTSFIFLKC